MTRWQRSAAVVLFVSFAASTSFAGGWAVATVTQVPDHLVVDQPARIEFIVRQHGHTLMTGASPSLQAELSGLRVAARIVAEAAPGRYRAEIVLPKPGQWTVTLSSGLFDRTRWTLPAVSPGQPMPVVAAAEAGLRVFNAKGCATCHVHGASGSVSVNLGPELTSRRYAPEALAAFVGRPAACVSGKPCMPVLEVDGKEMAALAAFFSDSSSRVASR